MKFYSSLIKDGLEPKPWHAKIIQAIPSAIIQAQRFATKEEAQAWIDAVLAERNQEVVP